MALKGGTCTKCGEATSKWTAVLCKKCEYERRKNNWPPKKKFVKKKCMLCGNINHLNFTQAKIWHLKETAEMYRQQANWHLARLMPARREHSRVQIKINKAWRFREEIIMDVQRKLNQIQRIQKEVNQRLEQVE